jgi:hypothetical protein
LSRNSVLDPSYLQQGANEALQERLLNTSELAIGSFAFHIAEDE